MCPWSVPPVGRSVPGGSVNSAAGSSVATPAASSAHSPGNRFPSLCSRPDRPLVVMDALMSIRIGSPSVGMPTAIGSGVNAAFRPPNGATLATAGSEQVTIAISPRSVARWRNDARQPMWWLRRITTTATPCRAARSAARSSALATSQTPGRCRPSQVTAAPRSATTSGSPRGVIPPDASSARYAGAR